MIINITETLQISVDNYKNHSPIYFKAGGDVIPLGKYKGDLTKNKWVSVDKYFRSLAECLHYCIESGLLNDSDKLVTDEDITLQAYLERLENVYKQLSDVQKLSFTIVDRSLAS